MSTAKIASLRTSASKPRQMRIKTPSRRPRKGRPTCHSHHGRGQVRSWPGIFPLGDRYGGRRLDHRYQRLQSARCRSQQDRDSRSDHCLRKDWIPSHGEARLRRRGHQALHRSKECRTLSESGGNDKTLAGYLRAHLNRIEAGDYFAVLGYIEMNDDHEARLQKMRHAVRDKKRVATCLGFGPRFLHSTGQAYKGGPNSGVFLQITCDDANDLPVPGAEIHLRHRESCSGTRRLPGAGGTEASRVARPSGC